MTALIESLKEAGQDFEFYPTTREIIAALVRDIRRTEAIMYRRNGMRSVLDIGAGNGKVLEALEAAGLDFRELYAIEKSQILCEQLDPKICVVGTDFAEQSLFSKQVDVIFSNPPYSMFVDWSVKIIRESAAPFVYLVIPERWEKAQAIAEALEFRDAKTKIVGSFDFENAEDRQARAKVHLVCVTLSERKDEAFEKFFREQFADLFEKFKPEAGGKYPDADEEKGPRMGGRKRPFSQLIIGPTYPEAMVGLYCDELAHIEKNYRAIGELDVDLMREFNISPQSIMQGLKLRLSGLRQEYWQELFGHLGTITDRLTSSSRKTLLETLQRHVHVDFTLDNILAVIIWVIKNANRFIDSQLIDTYEKMVDKCNVQLYKSNQRTWVDERWRYADEGSKNSHYALDYRIVTHRLGGIRVSSFSFERGLSERAAEFMGDLLTVANNLGFRCQTSTDRLASGRENWTAGALESFWGHDRSGARCELFDVRAFKNGNVHLRLNKKFILALNVEHGRLKGWLNSGQEAAEELRDPEAAQYFASNLRLSTTNPQLLLTA